MEYRRRIFEEVKAEDRLAGNLPGGARPHGGRTETSLHHSTRFNGLFRKLSLRKRPFPFEERISGFFAAFIRNSGGEAKLSFSSSDQTHRQNCSSASARRPRVRYCCRSHSGRRVRESGTRRAMSSVTSKASSPKPGASALPPENRMLPASSPAAFFAASSTF